jgi:hypothetical protein
MTVPTDNSDRSGDRCVRMLDIAYLVAVQPPGQHGIYRWLGYAVGSAMLVGALLYVIGLGVWLDRAASALRLSGWLLMAAALVVPSTLTLALPGVAAMVVTVANIPSGRGPQRSTPGTAPDGGQGSVTASASLPDLSGRASARRDTARQHLRRRANVPVSHPAARDLRVGIRL